MRAQNIKHKNTCTVEQEFQFILSFLIEVAHQEVTDSRSFKSTVL